MNNNLNCDNVCDLLELYHDDLVRPTTKEAVSNHLNECKSCSKEYEKIKRSLPEISETSTSKEFTKLMKKKKTKQIVITVICCLLTCLILSSTYLVLTEANLKVRDIEVIKTYKYEAPDGQDFFCVLYSYEYNSSSSPRLEVKRDYTDGEERTSIVYDIMTPVIVSNDYQGPYSEVMFFRADEISTDKQGIISNIDCDELIMNGEVVWAKEANGNDEVPAYIQAYYDMYTFIDDNNVSDSGDSVTISYSIDPNNLNSDENYVFADYPDKTIKWNLKGEVLEEKLK